MGQDRTPQTKNETLRISILGEAYGRGGVQAIDNQFYNCFPELHKNPVTGESRAVITKRPGVVATTLNTLHTDIFTGLGLTEGNMMPVYNMAMNQLNDVFICIYVDISSAIGYVIQYRPMTGGASVLLGTIAKISGLTAAQNSWDYFCVTETLDAHAGGTAYPSIFVTRTSLDRSVSSSWYALSNGTSFAAASLAQLTNATAPNYPDTAAVGLVVIGHCVQMNGIMHVMTTNGTIYSSGGANGIVNDSNQWAATAIIQTYQDLDQAVGLVRYKHHILALGTNSIEFLNDIGNPAPYSPLERTDQALIRFGALHCRAALIINDTFYWLANGSAGAIGLWKLDGYTPVKLSTPKEDANLVDRRTGSTHLTNNILVAWQIGGKLHVGIHGISSRWGLAYTSSGSWGLSATDTFYTTQQDRSKLISGTLVFNTTDNIWWWVSHFCHANTTWAKRYFLPASASRVEVSSGDYFGPGYNQTYLLFGDNPSSNSYPDTTVPNTTVFAQQSALWGTYTRPGAYYDDFPASGTYDNMPIPCMVGFNTLTFGTMHRKRINSVELVFARNPDQGVTAVGGSPVDNGSYSWSLFIDKTGHVDFATNTSTREAIKQISTYASGLGTQRMNDRYIQWNLGMGRLWNFAVLSNTKDPWALEFIDVDMQIGDH